MRMLSPYWETKNIASDIFQEMSRFFEDFRRAAPSFQASDERGYYPPCEVQETSSHYLMSMDLPGIRKEDIKIELQDNSLIISGERRRTQSVEDKESRVQRYEKSYGFFKRSFSLPTSVDPSKVEAHFDNGVLELELPKLQVSKSHKIEIQAGKESSQRTAMPMTKKGQESKAEAKDLSTH
jgi:HSP20 family protein